MRPTVRDARPDDAAGIARTHVLAWQQTYRGLMRDEVLDAPDAVARRERMWSGILADAGGTWRAAVADLDGRIVGFALTGDASDPDDPPGRTLAAIYLLTPQQGSGAADELLAAVLDDARPTSLWVADPNPRAQAFYRRSGFAFDGAEKEEDGVRELRMIRPVRNGS